MPLRMMHLLSIFAAIAFILPMLGGYVADRWLGTRRAVLIGSCLLVAGNVAIATSAILHASASASAMLYTALAAVALGNGLFFAGRGCVGAEHHSRRADFLAFQLQRDPSHRAGPVEEPDDGYLARHARPRPIHHAPSGKDRGEDWIFGAEQLYRDGDARGVHRRNRDCSCSSNLAVAVSIGDIPRCVAARNVPDAE